MPSIELMYGHFLLDYQLITTFASLGAPKLWKWFCTRHKYSVKATNDIANYDITRPNGFMMYNRQVDMILFMIWFFVFRPELYVFSVLTILSTWYFQSKFFKKTSNFLITDFYLFNDVYYIFLCAKWEPHTLPSGLRKHDGNGYSKHTIGTNMTTVLLISLCIHPMISVPWQSQQALMGFWISMLSQYTL